MANTNTPSTRSRPGTTSLLPVVAGGGVVTRTTLPNRAPLSDATAGQLDDRHPVAAASDLVATVRIPRQTLAECAAAWRRQLAGEGLVAS